MCKSPSRSFTKPSAYLPAMLKQLSNVTAAQRHDHSGSQGDVLHQVVPLVYLYLGHSVESVVFAAHTLYRAILSRVSEVRCFVLAICCKGDYFHGSHRVSN